MRRRAAALIFAVYLLLTPALAFSDVGEGDWYDTAVRTLVADGILEDRPGRPFQGGAPVSRGEFLSLVLRIQGLPCGEDPEACARAAVQAGLLEGDCPQAALSATLSRYEAAEILWRAMGAGRPPADLQPKGGIADEGVIPGRYLPAVRQGYLTGLFTGTEGDRRFSGESAVNRREAAVLLLRLGHPEYRIVPETEQILDFSQVLGSCVTYTTKLADRNFNIEKAAGAIDGTVLQPGEQFSFYKVVGNPGRAEGYRLAPAVAGKDHIASYGGGLCQNATTLFNAALYANLQIDERHCHSLKSTYVAPGYDATIYFGERSLDFKFTNTLPCPIRVEMTYDAASRALTCRIYGAARVTLPKVELSAGGGGHKWTLTRKADGVVNYTAKSTYQD